MDKINKHDFWTHQVLLDKCLEEPRMTGMQQVLDNDGASAKVQDCILFVRYPCNEEEFQNKSPASMNQKTGRKKGIDWPHI